MIELPIEDIIQQAIIKFAEKEAEKLKLPIDQVTLIIKVDADGSCSYSTRINGKWIDNVTRQFTLGEIIQALKEEE